MAQQPKHGDGNLNLLYKIADNTYDISQNGGSPGGLGTMSTQDADNVSITGGDLSGVTINAESLEVGNAVTADLYVGPDGNVGIGTETTTEKLTVNGNIDISNGQIKNLGVPLDDTDAATKLYVDTAVTGSVGATGPLPWNFIGVYDNGVSYNLNDAVTYAGGYYYRTGNPLNPGYPPEPGVINASWTPVADGGATGLTGDTGPQGATGLTGAGGASGYWGAFWSNQDQSAANTTTAYPITLNNTDPDSTGVSVVSNSQITFANAGVYNIQFSAQADRISGSGSDSIDIWFRKNGTDIPESNTVVTVAGGAAAAKTVAAWNYMLNLAAGDYVELVWRTSDINLQLIHEAGATSPTRPAIPSVIVTAQQVMYTQLGATGATGASGGISSADVQIFTSSGTWTKPVGAKTINVQLFGAGGGGGGGRKTNNSPEAKPGGAGGGGGGYLNITIPESALASTESVTIGAGGTAGTGVTATVGSGGAGGTGGNTAFNSLICAGGNGGGGGSTATANGGLGVLNSNSGAGSSLTTNGGTGVPASSASVTQYGGAGGGGGGTINVSGSAFAGGAGGRSNVLNFAGGAGGANTGAAGGDGTSNSSATTGLFAVGSGGGGGGAGTGVSGGAGGAGGFPSGGGGGGGPTDSGATSGAGGVGGNGIAIITTYF